MAEREPSICGKSSLLDEAGWQIKPPIDGLGGVLSAVTENSFISSVEKNVDVIVFENLEEIRENISNGKKFQSWAFRKLKEYVEYKAEDQGIEVKTVSPKYTSQRCSKCGNTRRENRNNQHFKCERCGYEVDSDYNASKSIGMKAVLGGQKSQSRMGNGQLALKSGVLKPNGNYFPTHSG